MEKRIKAFAQELRSNGTKEEKRLWYDLLRNCPVQFRRQVPFGPYILDFYCAQEKLGIEVDGSQHYTDKGPDYDAKREQKLFKTYGIRIIRFTNSEIWDNFEGVCTRIQQEIGCCAPSSAPCGGTFPPVGGRLLQEKTMKTVTIYTDGACSGNPGPGGWGIILMYGPHRKELSGGEGQTTNNRMELTGVITALEALKEPCAVELYSDSKYVIDGLEKGWAKGWRARGWIKSDKKPALNPDLWGKLLDLCDYHKVNLHWVKGHAENEYNNRCDELAVMESKKFKS